MVLVLPARPQDRPLKVPYFVLYWISTVSIFVLVLIILKARLRRHATFYSLFLSVILNGVSNLVQMRSSVDPSKSLSVFAAAGGIAFTTSNAGTATALVLKTFSIVAFPTRQTRTVSLVVDCICIIVPWLAAIIEFIGIALSVSLRPFNLAVVGSVTGPIRAADLLAPQILVLFFLCLCLILEFITLVIIYRRPLLLSVSQPTTQTEPSRITTHRSPFDRAFSIRVLVFGIWMIGALSVAADYYYNISHLSFNMTSSIYQSTGGLFAFLVFGTQRDILEYLHIIKPLHPTSATSSLSPLASPDLSSPTRTGRARDLLEVDVERGLEAEEVSFEAMLGGEPKRGRTGLGVGVKRTSSATLAVGGGEEVEEKAGVEEEKILP